MNWFYNLKFGYKIGLTFGLCLLLCTAAAAFALHNMALINANSRSIISGPFAQLTSIEETLSDMKQYRLYQERAVITADATQRLSIDDSMKSTSSKVLDDMSASEKLAESQADRDNLSALQQAWNTYLTNDDQIAEFAQKRNLDGAAALINGRAYTTFHAATDIVQKVIDSTKQHCTEMSTESNSTYSSARTGVIVVLALAIVLSILLAQMIARMLTCNFSEIDKRLTSLNTICLANLVAAVEALAQGNLKSEIVTGTVPLVVTSTDECGKLSESINGIIDKVKSTISAYQRAQRSLEAMIEHAHTLVIDGVNSLDKNALAPLCEAICAMSDGDMTRKIDARVDKMAVDEGSEFGKLAVAVNSVGDRISTALNNYTIMQTSLSTLIE